MESINNLQVAGALSDATWWWIGTGVLVAAELATATFYLLMLSVGLAAAAMAAYLGFGGTVQVVVAAVVGCAGVGALYVLRRNRGPTAPARSNRDVNLDIGGRVKVVYWQADGSTEVSYRGANWQARYEGRDTPAPGDYVIRALDGNQLVLGK